MAAIKPYNNGGVGAAMIVPTYVNARALGAGVAESVTVPTGAKYVTVHTSIANTTYVQFDGTTATVPGDTTNGSSAMIIGPEGHTFIVDNIRTISVISSGAPVVTFAFYS